MVMVVEEVFFIRVMVGEVINGDIEIVFLVVVCGVDFGDV